jgi:beta-glucosidase
LKLARGTDANGPIVTAEFEITNTGKRAGAEVAQIYVQDVKSSVARPVKELKGFQKVLLQAGETKKVSVPLDRNAFAFYAEKQGAWVAEAGEFKILAGASAGDIRQASAFSLEPSIQWND